MKLATIMVCLGGLLAVGVKSSPTGRSPFVLHVRRPDALPGLARSGVDGNGRRNATSQLPRRRIQAVQVTDAEKARLVTQGCALLYAMGSTDKDAAASVRQVDTAESPYQHEDWLDRWGYNFEEAGQQDFESLVGPLVDDALQAYGISRLRSSNHVLAAWEHDTKTRHAGVDYPATGGYFRNVINVQEGVITRWHNYGPRYKANKKNPPISPLPKLRSWSDIVFLSWRMEAMHQEVGGRRLRFIIASDISNTLTIALIDIMLKHNQRAAVDQNGQPTTFAVEQHCYQFPWARAVHIGMNQDPAKMLLASDNGRGNALLLITHKSTFGARSTINGITMWCSGLDGTPQVHLLFHVYQQG